ncbi:DUF1318 domain-containing protein [Novosphingobium umbonatum]|uniref:DUF1318 domain-containing protein n=1 Tax=Novosphingobium umbonatum TaxID=1908524 RepID=A0A437N1J5_9SPHN|nr:YdbL family protein [Novosphingobium umbonatum]RVU03731.1 DUF1318 domain-containing protein [Novosphingobium umbonatum]
MGRIMISVKNMGFGLMVAALALPLVATPAMAQGRDPAYAAARAAGQVGEMPTGFLGIVGSPTPDLKRMVDDINIRRKAVYAERAPGQHATLEQYAFTIGCQLIAQTLPGEKYQSPEGQWLIRGNGAATRDARCPA